MATLVRRRSITWDEPNFFMATGNYISIVWSSWNSIGFHPLIAAQFIQKCHYKTFFTNCFQSLIHFHFTGIGLEFKRNPDYLQLKNQLLSVLHFHPANAFLTLCHYQSWAYVSPSTPILPRIIAAILKLPFGFLFPEMISYRLGSMLCFLWMLWIVYLLALRVSGDKKTALWAVAFCIYMPRLTAYGMIASGEAPVMAAWTTAVYVYLYCFEKGRPGWLFGLVFGLALICKYQALFILPLLFLWGFLMDPRRAIQLALWGASLGTALFFLLQPQYYPPHTLNVLKDVLIVTFKHYGIPNFFRGQVMSGQGPWVYPWVMVGVTIPSLVLMLGIIGCLKTFQPLPFRPMCLLILINILFPLAAMTLPGATYYDGERLLIEVYPFIAIMAAWLFQSLPWGLVKKSVMVLLIAGMAHTLITVPPYYLAYFNQMVGGPLGAKQKGFESTYWLDAITPDMIKAVNREIPPNSRMARWGMPDDVLSFYQKQGLLRRDIGWDPDVTPADTYI